MAERMNFKETLRLLRIKIGFVNPGDRDAVAYFARKCIAENREVFDALVKS
ncbi:MAG: hypothetical protein WC365_09220 [Candidatus Babeliales bacterium]|jgi:hypothetical protein